MFMATTVNNGTSGYIMIPYDYVLDVKASLKYIRQILRKKKS